MNLKITTGILCIAFLFSCNKSDEKILYISDIKINCTGVAEQTCFQIKENENDDWSTFYSNIEGFDYEVGYSYKLKVEVVNVDNPPADATSIKYKLIEVLEKKEATVSLAKGSWLVTKIKNTSGFERNPVITLTLPQGQILGSTGCNKFFGNIELENNRFKVNTIGSTKMSCTDMDTEKLFLETLNEVAFYKMENDKLKLMNPDKKVIMECDYLTNRE